MEWTGLSKCSTHSHIASSQHALESLSCIHSKAGLAAVFSLGVFIILVAIACVAQITRKKFTDGVLLAIWGIVESTTCK